MKIRFLYYFINKWLHTILYHFKYDQEHDLGKVELADIWDQLWQWNKNTRIAVQNWMLVSVLKTQVDVIHVESYQL